MCRANGSTPTLAVAETLIGNETKKVRSNSRYRGNAIGNAQNLVVRNILSNLGHESFTESDWAETKAFFNDCCAYCGVEGELLIEHAVPINRKSLGEHRIGNLVPSCKACNSRKADKDFRDFLGNDSKRIHKIEEYMDSRNYVQLGDNEQVKMILEMAYQEVSTVADRYISIINELIPNRVAGGFSPPAPTPPKQAGPHWAVPREF